MSATASAGSSIDSNAEPPSRAPTLTGHSLPRLGLGGLVPRYKFFEVDPD
jgi:hypothetical protein